MDSNKNNFSNNQNKKRHKKPYYHKKRKNNKPAEAQNPEQIISPELEAAVAEEDMFSPEPNCNTPEVTVSISTENTPKIHVAGVRFKANGKIYFFDKNNLDIKDGSYVIVETARGPEFGEVAFGDKEVPETSLVLPLRPVLRIATSEDKAHHESNKQREAEAFVICLEKIQKHELDMKLVEAQYTFDNSKLLFYFTSAGRVDFRELVKDLACVFKTRIELRQIGIRDEAKIMGGLGACGRPLCCATFLSDFVQVSIKMAKEQNLSLNSGKISGCCGRLMCCLQYEYSTYEEETAKTPSVESKVKTPDGVGIVTEVIPLAGKIKVRLDDHPDVAPKTFHRDEVKVISRPERKEEK